MTRKEIAMDNDTCQYCINKEEFKKSIEYIEEKLDMMYQCLPRYPAFARQHADDMVAEMEKYLKP
jgi:hypothetical protein